MAGRGVLLVSALLLAVAAAIACGGEETKPTATATPTPGQPTAAATATGAAGAGQVKPVPTRARKVTPTPAATIAATAAPTVVATAMLTPTSAPPPTSPPPTAALPSWQTSAPREPVAAGSTVELGIRNQNGAPGETYAIGMQVNLPDGTPVNREGQVSGDAWTYFYVSDTIQGGTYRVLFGLPQSDAIYAEDSFVVQAAATPTVPPATQPSWQTSVPRTPVLAGDTVEIGLRNKWGQPGECYDFLVEVLDPLAEWAWGEDTVCAADWTYLTYSDTFEPGTYDVFFSIQDQDIAQDSFDVAEW